MTARAQPLQAPAAAPRLLRARAAAAYLGLTVAEVERLRIGLVRLGTAVRYDIRAIDAHLDALSGLAPQSGPHADNDPEAALDRFQIAAGGRHVPGRP